MSAEETLGYLLQSGGSLLQLIAADEPVSQREVFTLRKSFDYIVSEPCNAGLARSEKAMQCANVLMRLEEYVSEVAETKTGDCPSVQPLGFDESGKPVTIRMANLWSKKMGKRRAEESGDNIEMNEIDPANGTEVSSQPVFSAASGLNNKNKKRKKKKRAEENKSPRIVSSPPTLSEVDATIATVYNNTESLLSIEENVSPRKRKINAEEVDLVEEALNRKKEDILDKGKDIFSNQTPAWKFLNIPPRRRLQTLVVSISLFFTGPPLFLIITFLLFLSAYTFPLILMYCIWILVYPYFREHPYKPCKAWRQSCFWKHFRDYFPVRLIVPKQYRKQFDSKKNYLFAYHPHGVHGFGAMVAFGGDVHGLGEMLPGINIHAQTLAINFKIPFWRELLIMCGGGDASRACIKRTLTSGPGESVGLVVGGAAESLFSSPKKNVLLLNKRKGFVKVALELGVPLVPVYGFGETNTYYNFAEGVPTLNRFLLKMQKKMGFAFPLISGRGYFNYNWGPIPHRRPIVVVVGQPLELPKIPEPTSDDISVWHERYVTALKNLYNTHKGVYDIDGELLIR